MAGSIKGITIEFRGDTTRLDQALRQINNETKAIDKELRNVDKALKFNPTSVELWRQKQQLLTQKISETKEKLELLKQEQAQMDAAGVDKNSEEYRKLQREIIETESKLKHFEGELKSIGNVNLRALGEQFKEVGGKIEKAGQSLQEISAAAAAVTAAIGALAVKSGQWADDLNTMSKKYSLGTGELQKYSAAAELVDVDVETIAKSHLKLEKSMSSAAKGTGSNAEAFEKLGVEVTDANGELRNSDEVWQDVIKALGSVENETERDALAMQLMGKSAADLNPLIEDGGETYENLAKTLEKYDLDFVDQETLDQANEFNDALDTMKAIGLVALQNLGTQLAAYLAPALEKVVEWVGQFANWLTNLDPQLLAIIAGVTAFVAGLAPLLIVIGKITTGIGGLIQLFGLLTGPVGIVIAIIAALVAVGILLYKNWDTIKAKAGELLNTVKEKFAAIKKAIVDAVESAKNGLIDKWNSMKSTASSAWDSLKNTAKNAWNAVKKAITDPIEKAKDKVKEAIDKIKSFFPISIGNILKNVKTPHFSLNWGSKDFGKLGTLRYPTGLSVSWYKQGGIFDAPSLIGVGEAGPEAVVPLDKFWDKLDHLSGETNIVININGANKDPQQIALEVKRMLIKETNQRRLAWQ